MFMYICIAWEILSHDQTKIVFFILDVFLLCEHLKKFQCLEKPLQKDSSKHSPLFHTRLTSQQVNGGRPWECDQERLHHSNISHLFLCTTRTTHAHDASLHAIGHVELRCSKLVRAQERLRLNRA